MMHTTTTTIIITTTVTVSQATGVAWGHF